MKDIKEFSRLFKINIPYDKEFDYYITILSKSKEFSHLPSLLKKFTDFENDIAPKSVGSYKMFCLDKLVEVITKSNAYARLLTAPFDFEVFSLDKLKSNISRESIYVSVDMRQANYAALKYFDADKEFPNTYLEFCEKNEIHPVLAESKSFRQLVFGNTNPKRLQKFQHKETTKLYNVFKDLGLEEEIVFVSHDEIVFKVDGITKYDVLLKTLDFNLDPNVYKKQIYKLFKVENAKNDTLVKTILNERLQPEYKTLLNIPGNQYYMFFKAFVISEPVEDRDLYFMNDNRLAKWIPQEATATV